MASISQDCAAEWLGHTAAAPSAAQPMPATAMLSILEQASFKTLLSWMLLRPLAVAAWHMTPAKQALQRHSNFFAKRLKRYSAA